MSEREFILTKESIHGIKLYAEIARNGSYVWRVERAKATPITQERADEIRKRDATVEEIT